LKSKKRVSNWVCLVANERVDKMGGAVKKSGGGPAKFKAGHG